MGRTQDQSLLQGAGLEKVPECKKKYFLEVAKVMKSKS